MTGKIYREGIRQLKAPGFLVMILQAVFMVLLLVMVEASYMADAPVTATNRVGYVIAAAYVPAVPLFILWLFRFADSKKACDFYFGLPCRRSQLVKGYLLAVFTWIALVNAVTLLCAGVTGIVCGHVEIAWGFVGRALLEMVSGSIFLAGVCLLGISLTGSLLSNVAVCVMIVFVPVIFGIIMETVNDVYPYLSLDYNTLYLPGGLADLFGVARGGSMKNLRYASLGEIIKDAVWTGGIGFAYLLTGLWIFGKRRAEAAQAPALNRKLQMVFRLIAALIPSGAATMLLYAEFWSPWEIAGDDLAGAIICYLAAVIVFYLYEFFTTKKLRGLWKITWQLGILAVLNLLLLGGHIGQQYLIRRDVPSAEQMTYVYMDQIGTHGYFADLLREVRFEDDTVKQIISEALQENMDWFDEPEHIRNCWWRGEHRLDITVGKAFGRVERKIALTDEEYDSLMAAIEEAVDYRTWFDALPGVQDADAIVDTTTRDFLNGLEIYAAYLEDCKELTIAELCPEGWQEINLYVAEASKHAEGMAGINSFDIMLPISEKHVKARTEYVKQSNELYEERYPDTTPFEQFIEVCEEIDEYGYAMLRWNVYGIEDDVPYEPGRESATAEHVDHILYVGGMDGQYPDEVYERLREISDELKKQGNQMIDVNGIYLEVDGSVADDGYEVAGRGARYYQISETLLKELEKLEDEANESR